MLMVVLLVLMLPSSSEPSPTPPSRSFRSWPNMSNKHDAQQHNPQQHQQKHTQSNSQQHPIHGHLAVRLASNTNLGGVTNTQRRQLSCCFQTYVLVHWWIRTMCTR